MRAIASQPTGSKHRSERQHAATLGRPTRIWGHDMRALGQKVGLWCRFQA